MLPDNKALEVCYRPPPASPHGCADHNMVALWTPEPGVLHGLVYQRGRSTLIGNPPPEVAKELQRLLTVEWRLR